MTDVTKAVSLDAAGTGSISTHTLKACKTENQTAGTDVFSSLNY